jgi:hypothetical protein
MQFLSIVTFLTTLFVTYHVYGASQEHPNPTLALSGLSSNDSERLETGLNAGFPIPQLSQMIKIDDSIPVDNDVLIVKNSEEKNILTISLFALHSIMFNSHKLFLKSIFMCEEAEVDFKKFLDRPVQEGSVEMNLGDFLVSQGIFGIFRKSNEFFGRICQKVEDLSVHYYREKSDRIKKFLTLLSGSPRLTEINCLVVYEAFLGEVVHKDTTKLSFKLVIRRDHANFDDRRYLNNIYHKYATVKWFNQSSEIHMCELGYATEELQLVQQLCNYLLNNEDNGTGFFLKNSSAQMTLRKIVNPMGNFAIRVEEMIELVSNQGIFQALLRDSENIFANLTEMMELYLKSRAVAKLTPQFPRFFSCLSLLQGIDNNEQLVNILFKYLLKTQGVKDELGKIILAMKAEERSQFENWQFSVMEFKCNFLEVSSENQALVAVDEMRSSNMLPSIIGRSLAESYLQNTPFNQVFIKKFARTWLRGNNPQIANAAEDLGKIPKIQLNSSLRELNPNLYESEDIFHAVYHYRKFSGDDAVLSIDIMKNLTPKGQKSDKMIKFLRNLPVTPTLDDFKLFCPILQQAYFDGAVQEGDAALFFNRRQTVPQLFACLKGLTAGKCYSNCLDRVTVPDEILVVLSALRFC